MPSDDGSPDQVHHIRIRDASRSWVSRNLNFYRIHLLYFLFTPLVCAAIFWGIQVEDAPVNFIDSLFIVVSSMTVTGLATINLSPLTPLQQVLLFFLMIIGHPVTVSWVIVYVRRSYFRRKFGDIIMRRIRARAAKDGIEVPPDLEAEVARVEAPWMFHIRRLFKRKKKAIEGSPSSSSRDVSERREGDHHRIDIHQIRRMDQAPQLVDPSGWISEGQVTPPRPSMLRTETIHTTSAVSDTPDPPTRPLPLERPDGERFMPRTTTIEFAAPRGVRERRGSLAVPNPNAEAPGTYGLPRRSMSHPDMERRVSAYSTGIDIARTNTMLSTRNTIRTTELRHSHAPIEHGFGGFPGPFDVIGRMVRRFWPGLGASISRRVLIPRTETLLSNAHTAEEIAGEAVRAVPYLRFDTVVGRNSVFHDLTQEKLEELGGVEYRALTALLWIVGLFHICVPLTCFIIIAPYVSTIKRWSSVLEEQAEVTKYVAPPWFALFQVVSAYTNTGESLVDTSMAQFQEAYGMIIPLFLVIIAGNTGYPICLRLTIWLLTKMVPRRSQAHETLHFLLDHPRRCYIYLFPSHQTWFLATILIAMVLTDWVSFLVLDIGTPEIAAMPIGTRFAVGLLQAAAVRAAGFAAISLNALAPAVKVLYVTMMYVAVYPIALSVRSTNVYEEQSLGIFEQEDEDEEYEPELEGSKTAVWGRYLLLHARKQLSFDIWWVGLALWLVCIIERPKLVNPANYGWLTIFSVLFELVSAYGTVGLSLGLPDQNYSLSGAFTTLSKLVVIAVMIRGRHRGLPVAIDRAVLLRGYDFPDALDHAEGGSSGVPAPHEEREERRRGRPDDAKAVGFADDVRSNGISSTPESGLKDSSAIALHLMSESDDGYEVMSSPERPRLQPVPEVVSANGSIHPHENHPSA